MEKNKKYNLFLDDIRDPDWVTFYKTDIFYNKLEWVIVRSYDKFVECIIEKGMPNLISFDHDLADEHYSVTTEAIRNGFDLRNGFEEKTGYDALKWLCNFALENKTPLPEIKFHTANYIGFENMSAYYSNFLKYNPHLK